MPMPTLLDIAVQNGSDQVAGLIEESIQAHPEISGNVLVAGQSVQIPNVGASRTIRGRQYKTLVRTGLPSVGFRDANEGVAGTKSTFENRLVQTFILNPRWESDLAVADSHEDGPQAYIAIEALGQLEGSMRTLAKQFYYGAASVADTKGHPGLIDSIDAALVVDAGGTTADVASSVWAVKFGPKDVIFVYGENGALDPSEVRVESIADGNGNRFSAYVQELLAYPGLQVGSTNSIGRIKKLTTDAGKGLTDDMVYDLLALFPSGVMPDVLFMTRRSRQQLRKSRTATNATGSPAPLPTDVEGVPIAVTDAILNTESLTL